MKVPKQPEANIGMVGHVDHGKTTLTNALTGEWTDRHSEELKRGISIKLGYADTAFYKCPKCGEPECYSTHDKCKICGSETKLQRTVSFVDSPGHETLMATMLSGAAIMNGALLLIAGNEVCPQPQTKEHLMALDIVGVKRIVIVQNKIDIVGDKEILENYEQIKKFVAGTVAENAPIIPVSAHHDVNIDALIGSIEQTIPTPTFDDSKPARMYVARSFDVNKPGTDVQELVGGVLGGSLMQGTLSVGEEIEIAPGRKKEVGGKVTWETIRTKITVTYTGGKKYQKVRPGGLIAIGTELDPAMTKSDGLIGRVIGKPGTLPSVQTKLSMSITLLERVVGSAEDLKVDTIKTGEPLMLNVGTAATVGVVTSARKEIADVNLKIPVCGEVGQRIAISRKIGGKWRLIGYGILR